MIRCLNCGKQHLYPSEFCDACGAKLPSPFDGRSGAPETLDEGKNTEGAWVKPASQPPPSPARSSQLKSAASDQEPTETLANTSAREDTTAPLEAQEMNRGAELESQKKAHARLVITRGSSAGAEFPLVGRESSIGRWDADNGVFPDIDLDRFDPESKISRRHARITFEEGKYTLEDLGSTNGTFINRGRRLIPGSRYPLQDGDELILGKTFLKFFIDK